MDESIKFSIKARRDSFDTMYELTDEFRKEIDNLFEKINEFALACKDLMDFENRFASSDLNKEYIDLFTKLSATCTMKEIPVEENNVMSTKEKIEDDIKSDMRYYANDLTYESRRVAREKFDSKLRETPLGEVEQAANIIGVIRRFKKNKKDNDINE